MKEEQKENQAAAPILGLAEIEALKEQLKAQVLQEMKDEATVRTEEAKMRREEEKKEQIRYISKMKESPDPWVDIIGWVHTDEGVKVELEWNNAFVDYLRGNGINGADEEQVVQKWVTLLLRDMADQMDERYSSDYE